MQYLSKGEIFQTLEIAYLYSVFAYSQGVPELDGVIMSSRHNLTVVGRKRYTQHIFSVTHKPPGSSATVEQHIQNKQ